MDTTVAAEVKEERRRKNIAIDPQTPLILF
jgi:hypothetical protein